MLPDTQEARNPWVVSSSLARVSLQVYHKVYHTILCQTILHSTLLYHALLYYTTPNFAIPYCTIPQINYLSKDLYKEKHNQEPR